MNFPFSKDYFPTYYADDNTTYKRLRLYNVYKENSLLGQYYRHGNEHFFIYQGKKVEIQPKSTSFKTPQYKIIDGSNSQAIGEFILSYPYNEGFDHYPAVPYTNPYLKIMLQGAEYEFRRESPETSYWIFDSKTWGHYRFAIYNKLHIPSVSYSFKIEKPLLDGSISFDNTLHGNIEVNEENFLLLFAGFFLLETFLDDQDRSG